MRFQDKVAVVTGGAQGIGREIAFLFAKEKAKVIIFDVNDEILAATVNELKELTAAEGYKVDVTNLGEVEKNINKIIDNWTRVDILVVYN